MKNCFVFFRNLFTFKKPKQEKKQKKKDLELGNEYDDANKTLIPILPDDLIFEEILPRVSAKTLIRFKCVCKDWLFAISTPEFAKSHLKFSSLGPKVLLFGCDNLPHDSVVIDYIGDMRRVVHVWFEGYHVSLPVAIVGSCNGLICFNFLLEPSDHFLVWNPATHQYRHLVRPTINEHHVTCCGFGYAQSIDDYKIVALCSKKGGNTTTYHVYSSRAGNWRLIEKSGSHVAIQQVGHRGALIGETLYWIGHTLDGVLCVISFGLIDEQVKEIPWIDGINECESADIFGVNGCLALFCRITDRQAYEVWVIKEQDGHEKGGWEKLLPNFKLGPNNFVIGVTQNGKYLVLSSKFKVYDPSIKVCKTLGFYFSKHILDATTYVESLVSPFGLSSTNNDTVVEKHRNKKSTLLDQVRLYTFDTEI